MRDGAPQIPTSTGGVAVLPGRRTIAASLRRPLDAARARVAALPPAVTVQTRLAILFLASFTVVWIAAVLAITGLTPW